MADSGGSDKALQLKTDSSCGFAHVTMKSRFPSLITTVLSTNGLENSDSKGLAKHGQEVKEVAQQLVAWREEVASGAKLRALGRFSTAEDAAYVFADLQDYVFADLQRRFAESAHAGWLAQDWYFAEVYFYHLLLDLWGYWQLSSPHFGVDPYLPQKMEELGLDTTWAIVAQAVSVTTATTATHDTTLQTLLACALWGNRVDISYVAVASKEMEVKAEQEGILTDHRNHFVSFVGEAIKRHGTVTELGYIADNSGTELLLDLVLIDFLLTYDVQRVVLHVKGMPTYVSDATPMDFHHHIKAMQKQKSQAIRALGRRLQMHFNTGRIVVRADLFWASAFFFDAFARGVKGTQELRSVLCQHDASIVKGDANYRRMVLDVKHKDPTVPLQDVVRAYGGFPCPALCLRTLKSDPIVGLSAGMATALDSKDPQWRVNGARGVVQWAE